MALYIFLYPPLIMSVMKSHTPKTAARTSLHKCIQ